jgi:hypothetical protein
MKESLLRTCIFNKHGTTQKSESIPNEISDYIKTIQSLTKSFQESAERINSPESSELTKNNVPLESNIAGYTFQQYVTRTITTVHEYYWNAPLFTTNPVA